MVEHSHVLVIMNACKVQNSVMSQCRILHIIHGGLTVAQWYSVNTLTSQQGLWFNPLFILQ